MPHADIRVWRVELSFSIASTATNVGGMLKRFKQVLINTRIGCSRIGCSTKYSVSSLKWHDTISLPQPLVPSPHQFQSLLNTLWFLCFYCSTHSPLSLGILALSITFCTCSASFAALKDVKKNRNALILSTFEPLAEEYSLILLQRLL